MLKQHFKPSQGLPTDYDDNQETLWPSLMSIHCEKSVDYDAIVQKFAKQQPHRKLLVDPIFENLKHGFLEHIKQQRRIYYSDFSFILLGVVDLDYCKVLNVVLVE